VLALVFVLVSCSSGRHASPASTTVPRAAVPAIVPISVPGSAPLPTILRASSRRSACPASRPDSLPPTGYVRLDIALVAVAPATAEVCVYGGSGARTLESRVAFGGVGAATVVDALNTVAGIDPVSRPRCEPGPAAPVVVLVSDGLRTEMLSAALTGCRGVSNGLLSGAGTSSSAAMLNRSLALAAACTRRFPHAASCVAGAR
jgi:hypothetical protein